MKTVAPGWAGLGQVGADAQVEQTGLGIELVFVGGLRGLSAEPEEHFSKRFGHLGVLLLGMLFHRLLLIVSITLVQVSVMLTLLHVAGMGSLMPLSSVQQVHVDRAGPLGTFYTKTPPS